MERIDAFAAAAKQHRLRCYVTGIRSISLYTAAVTSGFDYVGGHALTPVVRDVGDISGYRLDAPYLSLMDAAGGREGRPGGGTHETH